MQRLSEMKRIRVGSRPVLRDADTSHASSTMHKNGFYRIEGLGHPELHDERVWAPAPVQGAQCHLRWLPACPPNWEQNPPGYMCVLTYSWRTDQWPVSEYTDQEVVRIPFEDWRDSFTKMLEPGDMKTETELDELHALLLTSEARRLRLDEETQILSSVSPAVFKWIRSMCLEVPLEGDVIPMKQFPVEECDDERTVAAMIDDPSEALSLVSDLVGRGQKQFKERLEEALALRGERKRKVFMVGRVRQEERNGHEYMPVSTLQAICDAHDWPLNPLPPRLWCDETESKVALTTTVAAVRRVQYLKQRWAAKPRRAADVDAFLIGLDADQCAALDGAASAPLSIVTGAPGAGKTSTLVRMVAWALHAQRSVTLAFPTHKAKHRAWAELSPLMEHHIESGDLFQTFVNNRKQTPALCAYGVPAAKFTMVTIAKMKRMTNFQTDLLLVDESSMVNIFDFGFLLDGPKQIVLFGDPRQLQPIGVGCPFLQWIKAPTVPVYRLTVNHRQVEPTALAYQIEALRCLFDNEPAPTPVADRTFVRRSLHLMPSDASMAILLRDWDRMEPDWLARLQGGHLQLMCAKRDMAAALTLAIRKRLHVRADVQKSIKDVRPGDLVVCCENVPAAGLFNGLTGTVTHVGGEVRVTGGLSIDANDFSKWFQYGFVLTVFKMQGSECDVAYIVLDQCAEVQQNRNLVFTALSRAKKACVVYASTEIWHESCQQPQRRRVFE